MPGREGPNPKKVDEVKKLTEIISEYPNIGILNMHKMPAAQLGQMRKSLSKNAEIVMSKKVLMDKALPEKYNDLKPYMGGQPALILTDMNAFKLFKLLEKNKTNAPAKIGDIAPEDIVVPEGDTGIPPGPAIGTFGNAGVVASVKAGSIHVLKDTVLVKEGEEITSEASQVLGLLKIEPMKIGLDLAAMYEEGTVFDKSVLRIDEAEFMNTLTTSIQHGINLAVEAGYVTKATAPMIIAKLTRQVRSLSLEAGIYSASIIGDLIGKAQREASSLSSSLPEVSTEEPKEEPTEQESQSSESQEPAQEQGDNNGGAN